MSYRLQGIGDTKSEQTKLSSVWYSSMIAQHSSALISGTYFYVGTYFSSSITFTYFSTTVEEASQVGSGGGVMVVGR